MGFNEFEDEIWDENQWESHINEAEKKSEELRQYLDGTLGKEPPRWMKLMKEYLDKSEAVDSFIEEELMFEEAYFPDDEDDWEFEDEDDEDDIFASDESTNDDFPDEADMEEEGEGWKMLSEEYILSDYGDIENWETYQEAHELAVYFLKYSEKAPDANRDTQFIEMVTNAMQIGAKLAGGYAFGFDADSIGGNIVYCKKALQFANRSLELLQYQKQKPHMNQFDYTGIHARLFEVRNEIGVHIQELRDRFRYENG